MKRLSQTDQNGVGQINNDATSSYNGQVRLAGDLGGVGSTAAAPVLKNVIKVINIKDYGALYDNSTDDGAAIDSAITAAGANGIVYFPGLSYSTHRHVPLNGQLWFGASMGISGIRGNRPSDYSVYYAGSSSSVLTNFTIRDMTLDANNVSNASCMEWYYASNCIAERVYFKNTPSGGWMMKVGVNNGATETFLNDSNKLIDCVFDTHSGSLEMLLLFNVSNTKVIRPKFTNNGTGPTLGLWQKCYGTEVVSPQFINNQGSSIYYSVTVEDTTILNPYMNNAGGIVGANTSDNGNFGLNQAQDLKIINPVMIGGSNTVNSVGIQLGSVNNVIVTNPFIEAYLIGIKFDSGNNSNTYAATNWSIINPQIINGNQPNSNWIIHPAIYFNIIGGSLYGKIFGGNIYDNTIGSQAYPITFDGNFTWDNIQIISNRLSKSGGGTSIALNNSAALGANVLIANNADYSGTPTQVILANASSSVVGEVQLTNDLSGTATAPTVVSTHLTSALPINQGGTGSISQNFVDLTTNQTIAGLKTFSSNVSATETGANKVVYSDNDNHSWEGDGSGYWRFRNAWTNNGQGFLWFAAPASGSVSEIMRLTGAGLLGIGKTPSATLDVNGNAALAGTLNMNNHQVNNLTDPSSAQDAATKNYVDNVAQGLSPKPSVRVATTGSETFTISSGNVTQISGTTVDGVSPSVNDRILVKDAPASTGSGSANSTQPGNGIYVVTANTTNLSLSRATDMDDANDPPEGAFVFIEAGTSNGSAGYVVTTPSSNAAFTYGTNNIAWTQFNGAGNILAGSGLSKSGNTLSIATGGVTNAMLAGSIAASKLVGTDITTVGTITNGTWNGTKVGLAYGGTNTDLSGTGGAHQVLMQTSSGGNISIAQLAESDISNLTTDLAAKSSKAFAIAMACALG